MSEPETSQVPQTLEGWYVLHDVYVFDWTAWRRTEGSRRQEIIAQTRAWLEDQSGVERGDSAAFAIVSQKGDLLFLHYRDSPAALNAVEVSLRQQEVFAYLKPAYSYLSVIEVSLYEVTAIAMKRLADRGLRREDPEFQRALEAELARQKEHMQSRLYRSIPSQRYLCFYPMNKRRGEHVNWYTLPLGERRALMRSHGAIGHRYAEQVTQVISGSVGLDDWEWGVSLHADDALVFKKLIYEMRFDPASALYAEFGPFYLGIRLQPEALSEWFTGVAS